MSANTKLEWADHTFNPWEGCQKVGPGCDHCYAEARNARFGKGQAVNWGPGAPRRHTSVANWRMPYAWNRAHAEFFADHGRRQRVFCASLADVFDNLADVMWRVDLFRMIAETPNLDWMLLTKRVGNAPDMVAQAVEGAMISRLPNKTPAWPWPNVWIGATVVNQAEADRDIPKLLQVPAAKRFLSMEPLLGPVDLEAMPFGPPCTGCGEPVRLDALTGSTSCLYACDGPKFEGIDWVIVGGESGPGARPLHPDWARNLRDQCRSAGVPFLFKQWGEHDMSYDRDRDDPDYRRCDRMSQLPGRWVNLAGGHGFNGERVHYAHRVGKKAAGRLLDGCTWDEVPA